MARNTTNIILRVWDLFTDQFNHTELASNWDKLDAHDHTTGKGLQIPTGGIVNVAVTNAKIADNAVTTAKILDANVTNAKLAANSVDTPNIIGSAVDATKLATNAVTTVKIADANVTTAKIADANVTTVKIADANITAAKIEAQQAWQTIAMSGTGLSGSISYYKDSLGIVHVRGDLYTSTANTPNGTALATFPAGARPGVKAYFPCAYFAGSGSTFAFIVSITTAGVLAMEGGGLSWGSGIFPTFGSIHYRAEN